MVDTTDDQQGIRPLQNGERTLGTAEHFMSDLNNPTARGKMMKPVFFVTGDSVEIGTNDKERRQALADWLTSDENEWFARAMVNRMWAELVGEGFYPLVDDIGPDRVAIAPKTLDLLSKEFVAHDYDVKWLVKTITATDAYQRQSRPRRSVGEKPFAANVPQPLRADQLYNVLTRFLEVEQEAIPLVPYGNRGGLRAMVESDFTYDPSLPREEVVGTIPQALVLMNSPLLGELLSTRATSLPAKVAADFEDDGQLVYETYLKALGREPTDKELAATAKHVAKTADRVQAVADLYWVLINSTEFRYRN